MLYTIWQRKKTPSSMFVKAESMQLGMDTLLSAAVLLGFFIAAVIQHMGYEQYAKYADPVMVVIASAFFIKMPAMSLIESIKDILHMAPDGDIYSSSKKVIEEIAKNRGFASFNLRIGKTGRQLTYKVGFISRSPKDGRSMGELDDIRNEVEIGLKALFDNPLWLGVSFMHDKKWG